MGAEENLDHERFAALAETLGLTGEIVGTYDKDRHILEEICLMLDVAMPISVAILDPELRYVFINSETYRLFGITPEDVSIGDHLSVAHEALIRRGYLDPELVESKGVSAELLAVSTGEGLDTRILPLGNGDYHRLSRRKLTNGYTVSTAENVTDLVLRNKLLQDTLILGESGYWLYDFATKHYEVSDSLQLLFRPEQIEDLKARGPLPAIHKDDRPAFRNALSNIASTGDRFEIVTRIAYFDRPYWFRSVARLQRFPDGRPRQLVCFLQNITKEYATNQKLARAVEEAVAANTAKSQFLANMSHEIRTPMNGVLGMAELLAGSALDDRQREFVNVITRSATSLLTVINDILDFSKIEANALELEDAPFSLRDTVAEITTLLSAQAAEKKLELVVRYPGGLPHSFVGDGVRVRQILTNLVGNAIKFTKAGHVLIDIHVDHIGEGRCRVAAHVVDTGIGIESDKLDTVFEKFTQADNSTTRVYGGTGLGLSISKRLAEMMGGTLEVSSIVGQGSTFTLGLELALDRTAKPVVRNTAPLRGRRALIVDDIDINRRLLSEQLSGWGMSTRTAPDGVEALLALKQAQDPATEDAPFDIILMDYLMPGVNGRELAAMIHAQPAIDVPILMLSSCDLDTGPDGLGGVDEYLVKPVREQVLYDAVLGMIFALDTEAPAPKAEPASARDAAHAADTRSGSDTTPAPASDPVGALPAKSLLPSPAPEHTRSNVVEVLVAEDFALNQDVVRLMLADTCYQPVIVENGKLAAELYESEHSRFQAVLMDVSMPVMDGYDATAKIRATEAENELAPTPIIALTGHALTHEREKCLESGMDDYLTKPVKQVELIAALDRWTGSSTRIAVA